MYCMFEGINDASSLDSLCNRTLTKKEEFQCILLLIPENTILLLVNYNDLTKNCNRPGDYKKDGVIADRRVITD